MSTILSQRGQENLTGLDLPWRFAPGGTQKYDKTLNPSGLISFSTAENARVQEELKKYVDEKVTIPPEAFLYGYSTNGGPRFREAMASFMNEQFYPFIPLSENNILVGGSVTAIENMLAFSIGDPGDGVLVSSPIYGRFELDFGNQARLKIVYAPMEGIDSFNVNVVGQFEKGIVEAKKNGTNIRALLISNPSNPLGQCYPKETLRALMELCQKYQIHLISDEIYALSVFDTGNTDAMPFTSLLSFDTAGLIDDDLLHVLYGMSKDFGAPGLRIGCLITRSIPVYRACSTMVRFHSPSGPSIAIGTAILEDHAFHKSFLDICRSRLLEGYRLTTSVLEEASIPYRRGGNVGLFVYLDLSSWLPYKNESARDREFALAQHLVDHGVFLHPGEEHCEEAGWFRLVFASLTEDELEEGLRRLKAALDSVAVV